jgi:hypothetical protein
MTQAIADPISETQSPAASVSPRSIAVWLLIQLTAIVLIVTRAKLWLAGGDDSAALELMLIMQIGGAALLLPALLPNLRTMVCVAPSAIPFLQIAGIIAAVDVRHVLVGAIAVTLWLVTLQLAMSIPRLTLTRAIIHALAVCVSIGGVILFYLRSEFSNARGSIGSAWYGPICAALILVRGESPADEVHRAWIQLPTMTIVMGIFLITKRMFFIARAPRA